MASGYLHTFFQLFQGPGMGGMIFEIQRRMIWGEIIEVSNYWDRRFRIDTLYHRYHVIMSNLASSGGSFRRERQPISRARFGKILPIVFVQACGNRFFVCQGISLSYLFSRPVLGISAYYVSYSLNLCVQFTRSVSLDLSFFSSLRSLHCLAATHP